MWIDYCIETKSYTGMDNCPIESSLLEGLINTNHILRIYQKSELHSYFDDHYGKSRGLTHNQIIAQTINDKYILLYSECVHDDEAQHILKIYHAWLEAMQGYDIEFCDHGVQYIKPLRLFK